MKSSRDPADEMAVRQRIFNSTSPFSGTLKAELKGSYPSCPAAEQEPEEEEEEGKDCKMGYMNHLNPLLNKVLTHGTAEQVGEMPLKTSTFIAQAECETQDSQEFSPSCSKRSFVPSPNCFTSRIPSEHNNVACPTTASIQEPSSSSAQLLPKKKTKKRHKGKKKVEKKKEKQRHRHRTSSGVPEQESGGSLVRVLEDSSLGGTGDLSSSCCSSVESSEEQHRGPSPFSQQISNTGSSCSPLNWRPDQVCGPLLSSYVQDSDSDSVSSLGNCSLALAGLRGCVSQGDPCYAGPFFKDVERDVREDEDEEDFSAADSVINEGIIFYNEKIQPVDSEYKEGREYFCSEFIKEGSYGEVHCAQDVNTSFKFAIKKVRLERFNSEEVGAWSTLRSPRVVELFGVVREGPNVVFFMDLKAGSLGQLILERGRLPEDLSLHYLGQVLTALEYLRKKKVVHLDIKADNVLLSEDGRDTFLCDFGHAERLDNKGQSMSGSRDLKGSETHMAPEIVKGEPRGAKADVWSSCCMLLHMLNGCQPWTRYYTCRLYLKIANDPPPLREIPPDCSRFTAEVIWAGLQKDAAKRASACELKEKTARALKEVGGLTSPVRGPYTDPLFITNKLNDSLQLFRDIGDCEEEEEHEESDSKVRNTKEPHDEDEERRADSSFSPQMLTTEPKRADKVTTVPELELRKLERDFYLNSLSQLHSAEKQEQLLSCLSSDPYSNWEPWDKKDSGRWSLSPTDDSSSGVFSFSSQPDVPVFSLDLLSHSQPPPPCCFEGVDVCIIDSNQRSIRIREKRWVKVGHIATGISDQISERVFTLETTQGQQVAHDEEVQESGLELCCIPAPDFSPAWRWRIRDGALETR